MKNALYRVNVENHIFNRIFKDIKLGSVHVGEKDNSMCAISSPKEDGYKDATLVVYDQNLSKVFSINTDKERPFTVARVHPLERTVACGDTSGRVLVYSGLQQAEPAKSILHWHNLPLTGLDWSEEGSVLYSGGGEAVMCKWRREDGSKPQFVPRVGAPIVRLGGGANLTVMQLQNNSLVLMDRQEDTVKGVVGGLCKSETGWPAGIAVDRDRLVMNGCVGKLQVFSTRNNNVHSLDITGQNYLTKERGATPHNSEVERVAVSQCGLYLATVDCLWSTLPRVILRLWSYDPTINNFSLNTQVDSPHTEKDTSAVVELRFQPTSTTHLACSPLLLSVGTDCRGKLWIRDSSTWRCSSSIQLRGLPATCGAWSVDGTILGIAFSHLVTLWDTDTRLRTTLSLDGSTEPISSLAFGCGAQARLVFSVTSSKLVSWDLLNLSPAWTLTLDSSPYTRLFPCPTSSLLALVQKDCVILVSSQTGEVIHKQQETNSSGGAAWLQDIKSVSGSALYFLTYSGQLQRLGSHYITSSHQTPLQSVPSHLGSLLSAKGGTADNKTVIATKQWTTARQEDDIEAVLSLPLHALPPPSQLKMTLVRNRLLALPKLRSVKSNRFDLEAKTDVVTRKKIEKFNAAFKFEMDTPEQMNLKSFCKLLKSTKLE